MKKLAFAGAALVALLASLVVGIGPSSAASTFGYTIIANDDGTCDLATLDLSDGTLTDLPAASSPEACVQDLAADSQGAVWGISGDNIDIGSVPAADVATDIQVVAFDADGTPSSNTVFMPEEITGTVLAFGGIAFDPVLGVLIQVGTNGTDPACPTGGGVCLLTYDPETGVATPIGGSGQFSTPYWFLTSCSSAIITVSDPDGFAFSVVDGATGAVSGDTYLDDFAYGYDCAPGTDTLYGISGEFVPLGNAPAAGQSVGVFDPETGAYSQNALVSDAQANIYALAVPNDPIPVTPTTTTTPPAAVAADTVTPAFTG